MRRLVWAVHSHLKIPRRRWRIAFLLGVGVLVNYFDRVNLSVAHAALITTFAISNVTFGYLSAAYNWTFTLCQLPVGVVLDQIRRAPGGTDQQLLYGASPPLPPPLRLTWAASSPHVCCWV